MFHYFPILQKTPKIILAAMNLKMQNFFPILMFAKAQLHSTCFTEKYVRNKADWPNHASHVFPANFHYLKGFNLVQCLPSDSNQIYKRQDVYHFGLFTKRQHRDSLLLICYMASIYSLDIYTKIVKT